MWLFEAFDGPAQRTRLQVEHEETALLLAREEQAVAPDVSSEVIEIALVAWNRRPSEKLEGRVGARGAGHQCGTGQQPSQSDAYDGLVHGFEVRVEVHGWSSRLASDGGSRASS